MRKATVFFSISSALVAVGACSPAPPQPPAESASEAQPADGLAAQGGVKILHNHTNPPIILGTGNSLVWEKIRQGGKDTLNSSDDRPIFQGEHCKLDLRVLNYAMIGTGVDSFDAKTVGGAQIKDLTHPLVFSGRNGNVEFALELHLSRTEVRYVFTRTVNSTTTTCTLEAFSGNHNDSPHVPKEFRFLDDRVTWNGEEVDMNHKVTFSTYLQ